MRTGRRVDQPDRLHFHQLVIRGLELVFLGKKKRNLSNPLATTVILPLAAKPIITAQFVYLHIYFMNFNTLIFIFIS